jgi:hypothetical protein
MRNHQDSGVVLRHAPSCSPNTQGDVAAKALHGCVSMGLKADPEREHCCALVERRRSGPRTYALYATYPAKHRVDGRIGAEFNLQAFVGFCGDLRTDPLASMGLKRRR